jgi:hypothetical protein
MKLYKEDKIKLQHNNKTGEVGTIDILRGCNGCENKSICYAAKGARRMGIDFFQPVKREFDKNLLERQLDKYDLDWVRIGCISDPSLDWDTTCKVTDLISAANKKPVVITKLFNNRVQLQISISGITPEKKIAVRKRIAYKYLFQDAQVTWRINSAIWKKNSKPEKTQENLISFAEKSDIPILDTPIRLFKTSPIWKLVEQEEYHRHKSPISGKLDNQRTAGLIIPKAYPCYSTCSNGPNIPPYGNGNDETGCENQCCTRL